MITGIMLETIPKEEDYLRDTMSWLTAYEGNEKLILQVYQDANTLLGELESFICLDFAIVDVTLQGALECAKRIRRAFRNVELLLIADISISPMQYLQPSIKASALLLRPESGEWTEVLEEFTQGIFSKARDTEPDEVFLIENREGKIRVPMSKIRYLEAREKKIYVCTGVQEFGMSGTLDKISERLPADFLRCHRSYIVNTTHVKRWKLGDNILYLSENLEVPVSRSYKGVLKKKINERNYPQ